jgi:hypothetical protein
MIAGNIAHPDFQLERYNETSKETQWHAIFISNKACQNQVETQKRLTRML